MTPPRTTWRLNLLAGVLALGMLVLVVRLFQFQILQGNRYAESATNYLTRDLKALPSRGTIYDASGHILAAPGHEYEIGIDLLYIDAPVDQLARDVAPLVAWDTDILQESMEKLIEREEPYIHLALRVSQETADALDALDYNGLAIRPIARRVYPEGELMCHTLGYVDFEGYAGSGLEGFYQEELEGEASASTVFDIPSNPRSAVSATTGRDLVLTIDRAVQEAAERHLREAIAEYGAEGGTVVAMNPKTGAILAMANDPCFDPFEFNTTDAQEFRNPSVSQQYEPGSVMKLVTMAAGLESGIIEPSSTYVDTGVVVRSGFNINNADEKTYGRVDMSDVIVYSINTGVVWIASEVGTDSYYGFLDKFGFGRTTGIDLADEASGTVTGPAHPTWTDATLASTAFGQTLAVTPLQMLASISAIANDGKLMQPYIVQEMIEDGQVYTRREPQPTSLPISRDTAQEVTAMAIQVGDAYGLHLPDHTVAGKTGTAQIPLPESGIYHPEDVIASFVGWLPADDPELIMLVKLDRPDGGEWGSRTAAPTFKKLASELVVLLDIPGDSERLSGTR